MTDETKPAVYDFAAINSRATELELEREFPHIMAHIPSEQRGVVIEEYRTKRRTLAGALAFADKADGWDKLRLAMIAIGFSELREALGHVAIEAPIADSGIGALRHLAGLTYAATKAYVDAQSLEPAYDSYRDDSAPARVCDHCGMSYRGPAVYCSLKCSIADA